MPFDRQYLNKLKKRVLSVVFAGAAIYGGYCFVDSVGKSLEQKIGCVSSSLDKQICASYKKIISLEDKVNLLEHKNSVSRAYCTFNSGVQITYSINGYLQISSGSVISSIPRDGEFFSNYVLCVSHAFEDSDIPKNVSKNSLIKVQTFIVDNNDVNPSSSYEGKIVVCDDKKGLALVYFESLESIYCAKIASSEKLKNLPPLSELFTVGCPLGVPLFKTNGELESKSFIGAGSGLWLTNLLVFHGNSGGGVYLSDTNELAGVIKSSGCFPLDNITYMPVSHISLMIPLIDFKDWLEKNNFGFLYKNDCCSVSPKR